MAYSHDLVEYSLASAQLTTSTGDKVRWTPSYMPHYIRAVAATITTATTVQTAIVNFTTQGTAGSNSGIAAGDVAILNLLTSYAIGKVVYFDNIKEKLISPKQSLVVNVGQSSTAGACDISILCEPSWETPLNNSNMIVTT